MQCLSPKMIKAKAELLRENLKYVKQLGSCHFDHFNEVPLNKYECENIKFYEYGIIVNEKPNGGFYTMEVQGVPSLINFISDPHFLFDKLQEISVK